LAIAQRQTAHDEAADAPAPPTTKTAFSLGPRQRTALISWAGFTLTFAGARALTHAIKRDIGPFSNVEAGGVHLHHYLWGIKLLAASGGLAIHGSDRLRTNSVVAASYGVGAALVVDEFALLVHLKDVYWTERGRMSVLIGGGLIGAVGASFAFIPAWHRRYRQPDPVADPEGV
jgi:hypothetical protein